MSVPEKRNRKRQSKIIINIFGSPEQKKPEQKKTEEPKVVIKNSWFKRLLSWLFSILILFLKWLWSHPKKLFSAGLAALMMWLYSFLPFKLPNLPFPFPNITKQQNENPKKTEEKEKINSENSKPVDTSGKSTNSVPSDNVEKVITKYLTNIVTETNIVNKTNYTTETKYITNFVIQPIVVTNTIFKEVPVTVTNVLIIKSSPNTNAEPNNKNNINGPAFFFADDFNTLIQNQQQNPVKGKPVN
jgi:hypothetical protein